MNRREFLQGMLATVAVATVQLPMPRVARGALPEFWTARTWQEPKWLATGIGVSYTGANLWRGQGGRRVGQAEERGLWVLVTEHLARTEPDQVWRLMADMVRRLKADAKRFDVVLMPDGSWRWTR